jgi:outer membrane protein assembly factor BamB
MNLGKNKTKTKSILAIFLVLTFAVTLLALPSSNAYSPPWTVPTSAYVNVTPSPVGVGQYCTIVVFVDRYSPTAGGAVGQVWSGYELDITKPDGTKETIGPWTCGSATGSDFKVYHPDQVGNYSIVFSWPGETITGSEATYDSPNIGDKFLGATSAPCILTVQKDSVPMYPETPVPQGYWTLPVNAQNRDWASLPSNWLKGSWLVDSFQRAGTGPKSAHILWTAQIGADSPTSRGYPGGLADAQWPEISNNINDYESSFVAPIIMNGIIYYNAPITEQSTKYGYYAVDLYTGNKIWYKNGTDNGLNNPYSMSAPSAVSTAPSYAQQFYALTCGQLQHYDSVNGNGVASFLWMQNQQSSTFTTATTTWYMVDALTGNVILTLKNVPSGTAVTDQDGNLLIYQFYSATGNIVCWNSSKAIYPGGPTSSGAQVLRPAVGAVIDAVNDTAWATAAAANYTFSTTLDPALKEALKTPHSGYTMNVTNPSLQGLVGPVAAVSGVTPTGTMRILQDSNRVPTKVFGSYIATTYASIGGSVTGDTISVWLASINEHAASYSPWPTLDASVNTNLGFTVTLDYNKNLTVPLPNKNYTWTIATVDYGSGVFVVRCAQTGQLWGYSLATATPLWGPTVTPPSNEQFYYYSQNVAIYNGVLLCTGQYTGTMYAYDAATGNQLWVYRASAAPYLYESAYGANMPLNVGAVCDGVAYVYSTEHSPTNPLWRQSYVRGINMTDGTLVWKLECFSQGISLADGYLVTASQYDNLIYCIGKGPSATTVFAPTVEVSLGSSVLIQGTVTDQSPGAKGAPAVSEASMETWMEYLYEQQPTPTDATGVAVHLTAIDPNGNFQDIGTTTSNALGNYAISWIPPVPGLYTVTATFEGSDSYSSSEAGTSFVVSKAAAAPAVVTPTQPTQTAAPTQTPIQTVAPSPSPAVQPPTSGMPTTTYIAIAAVIIIAVVAAVALVFRKRKGQVSIDDLGVRRGCSSNSRPQETQRTP